MRNKKTIWSFSLAFIIVVMAASSAQAECDAFPRVPWWGDLSHVATKAFVARKHEGNWSPYVKKWLKQVDKLKDLQKRESAVFVRYRGKKVKIDGKALVNYIKLVSKRVGVIRCLSKISTDPKMINYSKK
jgi:hypothetical protein